MSFNKQAGPVLIPGTGQNITATGSSQQSAAVGTETYLIRISAETANVRVEIGPNPTATATSALVKTTDGPWIVGCRPRDKVAVIQDSAGGVCNIVEMTY